MILAFDTSLPLLSAALVRQGRQVGAVTLEGRESRNEKLLPAVDWLLQETGVERSAIELLVATRGPGSFTGVRIGLATAEGLSMALAIPLCAMSTHEAIASCAGQRSVLVTGDAGRGELYVSGFRAGAEVLAPALMSSAGAQELAHDYELRIDVGEVLGSRNVGLLAAFRAEELQRAGRLDAYRDPTPIYVRLAEAEARLRGTSNG